MKVDVGSQEAFVRACRAGDAGKARRLLVSSRNAVETRGVRRGKVDVNFTDGRGDTPLVVAAAHGRLEVVKMLVNRGADATLRNRSGDTAYHLAQQRHHAECAEYLAQLPEMAIIFENSHLASAASRSGIPAPPPRKPLPRVPPSSSSGAAPVKAAQRGTDDMARRVGNIALCEAAKSGDFSKVQRQLQLGSDVRFLYPGPLSQTALIMACDSTAGKGKSLELANIVKLLLQHGAQIDYQDSLGRSALSYACERGIMRVIDCMLEQGADPDTVDKVGTSPLIWSAEKGHSAVVEMLLAVGAQRDHRDRQGRTAMDIALLLRKERVVEIFHPGYYDQARQTAQEVTSTASRILDDVEVVEEEEEVSMEQHMLLEAHHGNVAEIKNMFRRNPKLDVNYKDSDYGSTALMWAAGEGHEQTVVELLLRGANINAMDFNGWTAVMHAVQGSHSGVLAFLLTHDADLRITNNDGDTAADLARSLSATALEEQLTSHSEYQSSHEGRCQAQPAVQSKRPGANPFTRSGSSNPFTRSKPSTVEPHPSLAAIKEEVASSLELQCRDDVSRREVEKKNITRRMEEDLHQELVGKDREIGMAKISFSKSRTWATRISSQLTELKLKPEDLNTVLDVVRNMSTGMAHMEERMHSVSQEHTLLAQEISQEDGEAQYCEVLSVIQDTRKNLMRQQERLQNMTRLLPSGADTGVQTCSDTITKGLSEQLTALKQVEESIEDKVIQAGDWKARSKGELSIIRAHPNLSEFYDYLFAKLHSLLTAAKVLKQCHLQNLSDDFLKALHAAAPALPGVGSIVSILLTNSDFGVFQRSQATDRLVLTEGTFLDNGAMADARLADMVARSLAISQRECLKAISNITTGRPVKIAGASRNKDHKGVLLSPVKAHAQAQAEQIVTGIMKSHSRLLSPISVKMVQFVTQLSPFTHVPLSTAAVGASGSVPNLAIGLATWGVDGVCQFITDIGMKKIAYKFEKKGIDGSMLCSMSILELRRKLGIRELQAMKLQREIKKKMRSG